MKDNPGKDLPCKNSPMDLQMYYMDRKFSDKRQKLKRTLEKTGSIEIKYISNKPYGLFSE